jgi:23S rRNA (pseudouridine1915-N3)-methyltransferase
MQASFVTWKILAVGKPKLSFAAAGIEEYTRRIHRFAKINQRFIRPSTPECESAILLKESEGSWRVVLDEHGTQLTSRKFATFIERWEFQGVRKISLIVGGASGHGPDILRSADLLLCLSDMTLQHELALLFALEQIYRAYTILNKLPYHRE